MSSRAIQSHLLDERIAENKASQEIDLVTWIFDRLPVRPEDQVLELCCGTGGQTLKFLDLLGEAGHIVALDVSKEALQVLASKAGDSNASKLRLVVANLDDLSRTLQKLQFQPPNFDLIFCAYGL